MCVFSRQRCRVRKRWVKGTDLAQVWVLCSGKSNGVSVVCVRVCVEERKSYGVSVVCCGGRECGEGWANGSEGVDVVFLRT